MMVEQSNIKKILVTDLKGLDPISIYLEDFEPRKGKITISCYDKSWHSYWGGMGDRTIDKFFLSCDNHYIAKNLSTVKSSINDYDKLGKIIKDLYKDNYDEGDDEAYELYETIDSLGDEHSEWDCWLRSNSKIMNESFGDDWWIGIPTKENPEYNYLCRIIDATKEALKKIK